MSIFLVPLVSQPQVFPITLVNTDYIMTCRWNSAPDAGWVFDLADANTDAPIVANVPLIAGADCMAGLEYLGIGGRFLVYVDGDQNAVPTLTNLGAEGNLYFVVDDGA